MKVFFLAVTLMVIIAVGADLTLNIIGFSTADQNKSPSVRLDAPSH